MSVRLEHANLVVGNIDGMIGFLQAAFPEFQVRADATTVFGARWVHVGTDETYLALSQSTSESAEDWVPYSGRKGTNHLGYEVDDVEATRKRLLEAGFKESTVPNDHPHRSRVYFRDGEGNDWEFVEYSSKDHALRNDYGIQGL